MREKRVKKMKDTKVELLFLSEDDMVKAGVLDAKKCVDTMEEVMSLLSKKDYIMGGPSRNQHGLMLFFPEKSDIEGFPTLESRDRRFMAMPAYLGGRFHMAGQKWYGSNGENAKKGLPRSILTVSLNDVDTGAPIAYMSGNLLSAMRTGAMPGLAARYLAKKNPKVVSIIGPGVVNRTCIMAYLAEFPTIDTVKIKGSSPKSKTAIEMKEFIEEKYPQVKTITICETYEEALTDADIISEALSCLKNQWPTLDKNYIKPGALIISSGSMMLDLDWVEKNTTKVVDNIGMYEEYVNDFQENDEFGSPIPTGCPGMWFANMISDGKIEKDDVRHMGDIVRGIVPGRTSDDEIILTCLGGMPIEDVGWGYECYQSAIKQGIGTKLKIWDIPLMA